MQIKRNKSGTFTIETSSKILKTPFFYPSISSIKTNYPVYDYYQILSKTSYPGFLISAYDIYHNDKRDNIIEEFSKTTETSTFTLMDSGNYEASWNNDSKWDIKKLESILKEIKSDFCFSFDIFWNDDKDIDKHVEETITYSAITAGMQISGTTIPIIHSTSKNFMNTICKVVETTNPQIIGIPERELGTSLMERAKTLKLIRNEIDKIEREIPIHVLGTGNPISILIYSICGADLYDGLEWCKNVVNPETGHLFHFIQKDLVDCNCKACKTKELPYDIQTMWHNLIFYERFTEEIRKAIDDKQFYSILDKYLPKTIIPKIKKIAGI